MKKQVNPLTAEEEYPELEEVAEGIATFVKLRINNIFYSSISGASINTKCSYPVQCTLEMVIKKLEEAV